MSSPRKAVIAGIVLSSLAILIGVVDYRSKDIDFGDLDAMLLGSGIASFIIAKLETLPD